MNFDVIDLVDDEDSSETKFPPSLSTTKSQQKSLIILCNSDDTSESIKTDKLKTPISGIQLQSVPVSLSERKVPKSKVLDDFKGRKISYYGNNDSESSDDEIPLGPIFNKRRTVVKLKEYEQISSQKISCNKYKTLAMNRTQTLHSQNSSVIDCIQGVEKCDGKTSQKFIMKDGKEVETLLSRQKNLNQANSIVLHSSLRTSKQILCYSTNSDSSDSELEILDNPVFLKKKLGSGLQKQIYNPYKRKLPNPTKKLPFPSTHTTLSATDNILKYPALLSHSKQYPDLRVHYALSLWKFGNSLTTRAHERRRLDQVIKKVVRLVLSAFPIRSLEEFLGFGKMSEFSSSSQKEEVKYHLEKGGFDPRRRLPSSRYGQGFYTITEACLVVMYERIESQRNLTKKDISVILEDKESWISLNDLIHEIDLRLRPECPYKLTKKNEVDGGAAYYTEPSTRSAEFLQIAKLECELGDERGPRIKRHRKQGRIYFELLEVGYDDAGRIRSRSFPSAPGHYRCSKIKVVMDDFKGICLGVDRQEGGGASNMLHEMCGKLDMCKIPYFVGSLAIGDYVFFTSNASDRLDFLCPIIIERKSIQDVALSIYDGRWKSQKLRMYKGQFIFGYNKCRMVYIIEGNEKKQLVSDNYVGNRWHNIHKDQVMEELDLLESEGFYVIRTPSRENTMFELARWAKRVAKEIKEKTLSAEFTYQQFKEEMKKIPASTDFSRLAKFYAAEKKAANTEAVFPEANDLEVIRIDEGSLTDEMNEMGDTTVKKQKTDKNDEFKSYSRSKLQELCKSVGLPVSGDKQDLISRYCGPHPPKIWLARKQKNQYVPSSYNVAGAALLVALYLHERKTGGLDKGLTKDELYVLAEGLNITKNPFSGGTTQTGPYHYDGWSSMKKLLHGDPALVVLSKRRYKLTRSCNIAGYFIAEAIHKWCHDHNNCSCCAKNF